ncbi:hypothetical protein MMC07_004100 [Pseudocyphellaria aurata]|nr:hypothetical protein [Pseudocyphellaria aurata]
MGVAYGTYSYPEKLSCKAVQLTDVAAHDRGAALHDWHWVSLGGLALSPGGVPDAERAGTPPFLRKVSLTKIIQQTGPSRIEEAQFNTRFPPFVLQTGSWTLTNTIHAKDRDPSSANNPKSIDGSHRMRTRSIIDANIRAETPHTAIHFPWN